MLHDAERRPRAARGRPLAYTFVWEPPDPEDVEMLPELSFGELGGSTEVALSLGPFESEARRQLHFDGWTDSLDRLEQVTRIG
jgi:uncharacterized protein YndB with AHSA1/START domain